jgi:hypothetical protein
VSSGVFSGFYYENVCVPYLFQVSRTVSDEVDSIFFDFSFSRFQHLKKRKFVKVFKLDSPVQALKLNKNTLERVVKFAAEQIVLFKKEISKSEADSERQKVIEFKL